MFDLGRVIGGREHDDRHFSELGVTFDLAQDLDPVDLRHADVQEQQVGGPVGPRPVPAAEQEIQHLLAVLEPLYGVLQAGSLEILHDEPGMTSIVVRNQNGGIGRHLGNTTRLLIRCKEISNECRMEHKKFQKSAGIFQKSVRTAFTAQS
jgi:hypothetical protein